MELEHLVCAGLEALESGGEPALEEFLARHPEHAADVRGHVVRLARMGLAGAADARRESGPSDRLGNFLLIENIGQGGMGLVWEAEDVTLGRRVALKMIRPEQLWFPGARERFRREVEAVARLQHPGIVPVYSAGDEGGVPFFTMELIDGCTLADVLRVLRGRDPARLHGSDLGLAIEQASARRGDRASSTASATFQGSWIHACLQIARQVAEALDHAHGRGLVHRDVKPSNIAITRSGRAMLLDFGLVRSEANDALTRSGSQPGSLPYMSPEQLDGDDELTARTDVYSLGAVMYELFTLVPAFADDSFERLRQRIALGEIARPRDRNASIPWDVETVCLTALAREPEQRYWSADDLARDLGNLLARRPIEARRAGALLRLLRWSQRHPRSSAALIAAVPLVLVALAGIAWRENQGRAKESRLRGEADASASFAREEHRKVLRLSDVRRLSDIEHDADRMWPATPDRVSEYESWLTRVNELVGRIDLHRSALAELESAADATRDTDGRWRFASTEEQWQHDTLSELIQGLERLSNPAAGLVASVTKRLEFARTIDARSRTSADARRRWSEASSAIADRKRCPAYDGLVLKPQLGLLPIGPDSKSGLWEFAHLQTGEVVERDAEGELSLRPECGVVFVLLPGGRFRMGSSTNPNDLDYDSLAASYESPQQDVVLDAFFLSKYPMTHEQWERFTGRPPPPDSAGDEAQPLHPVVNVSWIESRRAMDQLGLELPTEAQWEYASRGGTHTRWWTGQEKESLRGAANLLDATVARSSNVTGRQVEDWLDDGYNLTSPIDAFRPNPFGLYDMIGNVHQLCRDAWTLYSVPVRAGDGERVGGSPEVRTYRGASCSSLAVFARSAFRQKATLQFNYWNVGMRPSRPLEP